MGIHKLDDNLNVTNKLLSETGTDKYLRNETAVNYNLSETKDKKVLEASNVLSVTLGVKW